MNILLTGATGFVGRSLAPLLHRAGHTVRAMSRNPEGGRERHPEYTWVYGDADDRQSIAAALDGCDAAYYLMHSIGEGDDYRKREVEAAARFAEAAAETGVGRIVYLGGVAPQGQRSEHLLGRLQVGEALREGAVPAIELRASMIIGDGSTSWYIVRDLAARLPVMVLPEWLKSRTQPVAIDDVVAALLGALELPLEGGAWYDIPGPDTLSGKEILSLTADEMGLSAPTTISVPMLTPWLSSQWVALISRAEPSVARELIAGLTSDLLAQDDRYWGLIGYDRRMPFKAAVANALEAEKRGGERKVSGLWELLEAGVQDLFGQGSRGEGSAGRQPQ